MVAVLLVVGGAAAMIGITSSGSSSSNKTKAKVLAEKLTPTTTAGATTTAGPAGPTTTTVSGVTSVTSSSAPSSTTTTVASAASATTTSTTIVCRNSYDARCGRFYFDPAAAPAQHTSMTFHFTPTNPSPGDTVAFAIHISEPNTVVGPCSKIDFGDGLGIDCQQTSASSASCPKRYGPWTPPAKQPHETDDSFSHRYEKAGSYVVTVTHPLGTHCYDPWEGTVSGSVTVTVG
jgi:hypothetical protein